MYDQKKLSAGIFSRILTTFVLIATAFTLHGFPTAAVAKRTRSEILKPKAIQQWKKKDCVFFHVWATWCLPCIEELPKLLKWLEKRKKLTPVVIDVSSEFSQKQFSKKWVEESLKPPFTTFRRPDGKAEPYLNAIDKKWSGTLPYTFLYHRSKKLKVWKGTLALNELAKQLPKHCQ